eukprot:CAMPEP_0119065166 /NCGR_PEP_ID=MMETSP1178-20130426/8047_1 /TAXON_ID=33656 /ORGANISM="unid sp, Strain CCMP2000" /LENGTH=228 /DNA_ID=CAMNT_0007046657 /DNA_START=89 /DNA_END=775 /DNA_ORIENTATION=+
MPRAAKRSQDADSAGASTEANRKTASKRPKPIEWADGVVEQGVSLKIRRLCALPTCEAHGGQYSAFCSVPTCNLSGRPHTKLFSDCTAGQPEQKPLWRDDAAEANNPATWYHFPAPEDVMEGITLPPELQGKSLQELSLSVCESHVAFLRGPAGKTGMKGSSQLRTEPELAFMNGKHTDTERLADRRTLARRIEHVKLLAVSARIADHTVESSRPSSRKQGSCVKFNI